MILTCPECATRYQTDAALFMPEGRRVRCAKCGHIWFQAAPETEVDFAQEEPEPAPEEEPLPQRAAFAPAMPQPAGQPAAHAPPRPRRLEQASLVVGWLGLVAILSGIGWSAVHYRQEIASLWPQSSTLYAAVGMHVNTRGIDFADKSAHLETENGQDVLVITGNLVNITAHELTVPPIRVSLTDADRHEIYHWNFSPGVATLKPGESAPFHTRLSSPPATMKSIELRFVDHAN